MGWEGWNTLDRVRVAAMFRRHVRTPCHPRGRIRREPCFACGATESIWESAAGCVTRQPIEAHHPDYTRPFAVVWVCWEHHRALERGDLKYRRRDVWDYSSLVPQVPSRQLAGRPSGEASDSDDSDLPEDVDTTFDFAESPPQRARST